MLLTLNFVKIAVVAQWFGLSQSAGRGLESGLSPREFSEFVAKLNFDFTVSYLHTSYFCTNRFNEINSNRFEYLIIYYKCDNNSVSLFVNFQDKTVKPPLTNL